MDWLAPAATLLLLIAQAASPATEEAGRALYEQGVGRDAPSAVMGDPPQPIVPQAAACAACHGALGLGASEGGVAAPALAYGPVDPLPWLAGALRDGRGRDGRALSPAMPRYRISDRDLGDLAGYIGSLPYPHAPGLTADRLLVGLNLEGGGFDAAEQALLREHIGRALASANDDGGFYGRTLALAEPGADAFVTIGWQANAGRPGLAVLPPSLEEPDCAQCCGSLHAGTDAQVDWLARWLEARGTAVAYRGPLAERIAHPVSAREAGAIVFIGRPDGVAPPPPGPLYLFADLGPLPAILRDRPRTYLISSFDFRERGEAVAALMRADPRFAEPRTASAAIELDRALAFVRQRLREAGRRVTQRGLCDSLRGAIATNTRFDIIDVETGMSVIPVASSRVDAKPLEPINIVDAVAQQR